MLKTAENSTINCRVQKAQSKFGRKGLMQRRQNPQSRGWKTTLDITFHWKIGLQIRQICLQLKTFGALRPPDLQTKKCKSRSRGRHFVNIRGKQDQLLLQIDVTPKMG